MKPLSSASTDTIDAAAALWLSRRDRGLSAAEQDEYMAWLARDPRHAEAVTRHAATLERMMQLYEWQPGHDSEANPDLFAPSPRRGWWLWTAGLAAAAAIAVAFVGYSYRPAPVVTAVAPKSYLHVNERLALPDGSRVELKDGSNVVVLYSDTERRVKLTGGEAHFTVWKDRTRPFVVDVGGIEVRAVGTAFNVRLESTTVEVLVTDGVVKVDAPGKPDVQLPEITMGKRAVLPRQPTETPVAAVTQVTLDDINRELAWQAPRLQFSETPLVEAVAEFNRLNRRQIVIADPALNQLRIGGTWRPDNTEGFVRLLTETLELRAETEPDGRTILRR